MLSFCSFFFHHFVPSFWGEKLPWRWWLHSDVLSHVLSFIIVAIGSYHLIADTRLIGLASRASSVTSLVVMWHTSREPLGRWGDADMALVSRALWFCEVVLAWHWSRELYGSAMTYWRGTGFASLMVLWGRADVHCSRKLNGFARICWRGIGLTSLMVSWTCSRVISLQAYDSAMMCCRVINLAGSFFARTCWRGTHFTSSLFCEETLTWHVSRELVCTAIHFILGSWSFLLSCVSWTQFFFFHALQVYGLKQILLTSFECVS